MNTHLIRGLMVAAMLITVTGCSGHYRVTDPASGKMYYTTKVEDAGRGGAVKIKDERSGSTVTLQSSEVREISAEEYEAAMKAQPTAPK